MSHEVIEIDSDSSSDTDSLWTDSLRQCLDDIQSTGEIASFNHYPLYANPGLRIGDRSIPLPLTENDAQYIKGVCRQAPFGKGDETLVDTSVRKTWELGYDEFALTNPHWPSFFDQIVKEVGARISLGSPTAKPYKLLLYEPGSFFKAHKDSEKETGMVGTLVICLPSKHEGADVYLSFGSETRTFKTALTSEHELSSLAWFSDVTHEVKELTSGYRLVLTYNLIQTGGTGVSPSVAMRATGRLKSLLLGWKGQAKLVYPLDHKYTPSSLCLQNMKGRDLQVCQLLHGLGSEIGLFVLFAQMTREKQGGYDFEDEEEEEEEEDSISLTKVVSPTGALIAENVDVDTEGELLGGAAIYEGRDPDEEDEGEFMGNESAPSNCRYHNTVLVLVRKDSFWRLAAKGSPYAFHDDPTILNSLRMFQQDLDKAQLDPTAKTLTINFMRKVLVGNGNIRRSPRSFSIIVSWAFALGDKTLFANVMATAWSDPFCQHELGKQFAAYVESRSQDGEPFDWEKHLEFVSDDTPIGCFSANTNRLMPFLNAPWLRTSFEGWCKSVIGRTLDSQTQWDVEDLFLVNSLMKQHQDDPDWLLEKLLPNIVQGGKRRFLFEVLHTISASKMSRKFVEKAKGLFEYVLVQGRSRLMLRANDLRLNHGPGDALVVETMGKFMRVLEDGYVQGAWDEVEKFLDATCTALVSTSSSWKQHMGGRAIIEACLSPLSRILEQRKVKPMTSVRNFYEACLRQIAAEFPRIEPYLPRWSFPKRPCSLVNIHRHECDDCREFNTFLASPDAREWEFRGAQPRRKHIESALPEELFARQTVKDRTPYRLVVTKRITMYQRAKANFDWQVQDAKSALNPLKVPYILELMGSEMYQELVTLDEPQLAPVEVKREATGLEGLNVGENEQPAVQPGLKREADDAEMPDTKWPRTG